MSYVQSLFYLFLLHLHIIAVIFHLSTLLICPRVWHGLLHLLDLCGNVYHLSIMCWRGILDVFIQLRFLLCRFILFFILVYNFCIYSILKIPWIFVKYFVFFFTFWIDGLSSRIIVMFPLLSVSHSFCEILKFKVSRTPFLMNSQWLLNKFWCHIYLTLMNIWFHILTTQKKKNCSNSVMTRHHKQLS